MTEQQELGGRARGAPIDAATEDLAQQVADQVESFLLALRAISTEGDPGRGVSLLLLEVSQVLLAGARLGVQTDFTPSEEFEPDPGPDPDLDAMRLRLARMLEAVDVYSEVFDPYGEPEVLPTALSDDLTSVATALVHGLRHYRDGRVLEALWWWQFSYLSHWGAEASGALRALQSVLTHDRLDTDFVADEAPLAAATEMLDEGEEEDR